MGLNRLFNGVEKNMEQKFSVKMTKTPLVMPKQAKSNLIQAYNIMLTSEPEEHEKKWVAFSRDKSKVVACDESLLELKKKTGEQKLVFMKVPPADAYLSF